MDFNAFVVSLLKVAPDAISDLHFKVGGPPLLRINNNIRPAKFRPFAAEDTERIASVFLTKVQRENMGSVRELDTAYTLPDGQRFRVNLFRQRGTFSIVMRVIAKTIPTVESLGLPPVLKDIAAEPRGLVMVTGITGSGKSSTLAALVNHINHTRRAHILTIEDPIEYVHEDNLSSINQREVGVDTESFAEALRKGLRQDPDVIMVGEMRDLETVDIALKAAETGHLVMSTLHTVDAAKTIGRIINVFPPEQHQEVRHQIAANVKGIISQRLISTKDGKKRVPAMEIMRSTATIRNCITDNTKTALIKDVIEKGREVYHMQSFDQNLAELFRDGVIAREVAVENSSNPADFERALQFE
jgi:twitching motility protein PilT